MRISIFTCLCTYLCFYLHLHLYLKLPEFLHTLHLHLPVMPTMKPRSHQMILKRRPTQAITNKQKLILVEQSHTSACMARNRDQLHLLCSINTRLLLQRENEAGKYTTFMIHSPLQQNTSSFIPSIDSTSIITTTTTTIVTIRNTTTMITTVVIVFKLRLLLTLRRGALLHHPRFPILSPSCIQKNYPPPPLHLHYV